MTATTNQLFDENGKPISPEDAGFKHDNLDSVYTTLQLNDLVEIITTSGLCLMGLLVCNKDNIIRITDALRVVSEKELSSDKKTLRFVTSMLPWRLVGDWNYAQFNKNDISNITKVSSPDFVKLWDMTVDELARIFIKSGNPKRYQEIIKETKKDEEHA